jgi:hypothetical protein
MLSETDASRMPRSWLRWAVRTLQATRKTTPGTPVDNQIGSYLADADLFVTGDRAFESLVRRIRAERGHGGGTVPGHRAQRYGHRDTTARW